MEEITPVTVVFITADQCGACKLFKQRKPLIEQEIKKLQNVSVVSINLNKTNDTIPESYPSKTKKYLRWFPFIFMTETKKWENNSFGDEIKIFNGFVKNGKSDFDKVSKYKSDHQGIPLWIKTERPKSKIVKAITEPLNPYNKSDFPYESVSVSTVREPEFQEENTEKQSSGNFNILSAYDVDF